MIENIRRAFQGIWGHKMRSVLTMLGIIIGVTAVIALITTVSGVSGSLSGSHGVEQLGGFDDAGAGDEFHSCHFINSGWCDKNSSARARSWGVSMPMVSTSVMPTPIL